MYEWDYARQLLDLRILEAADALDRGTAHRELYSEPFLIKRPLLRAIDPARTRPAVLLIDEIDRADEEFEGYLLELLAEFQITIPELGTVRAVEPPLVVLTSNRTRASQIERIQETIGTGSRRRSARRLPRRRSHFLMGRATGRRHAQTRSFL